MTHLRQGPDGQADLDMIRAALRSPGMTWQRAAQEAGVALGTIFATLKRGPPRNPRAAYAWNALVIWARRTVQDAGVASE